ncbi:Sps4 [Kluyveromyces lactis]|nr:Sps4 [Kluyveromyces lactis]
MSIFRKKHNQPTGEEQTTVQPHEDNQNTEESQNQVENQITSYKTVDHINGYPLVQQTKEILDGISVARVVKANTLPTATAILTSKPVKFVEPVTKIVDTVADTGLTVTEKVIPSLKTKTYQRLGEEAMIPYNLTSKAVNKTVDTTVSFAENYIYEPTHNQILKFRQYYNEKVYDTHGKPLIRGSLDPLVSPCNKWYESLINSSFPEGKEVPTNGFSNELDRSFALTFNAIQRAASVFNKRSKETILAPCNYVKHVNDVLNVNLDNQEDLSLPKSWVATKDSFQELNQETIDYIKSFSPLVSIPGFKKKGTTSNDEVTAAAAITEEPAESEQQEDGIVAEQENDQQVPTLEIQHAEPIEAN